MIREIEIEMDACRQIDIIEEIIRELILDMCTKRVCERNEFSIRKEDVLAVVKELKLPFNGPMV